MFQIKARKNLIALSTLLSLAPNLLYARITAVNSGKGASNSRVMAIGGLAVQQTPGEYRFVNYDETKLQTEILNVLEKRSLEDKQYIESVVQQLNLLVNDLINEHINSGLQKMSENSSSLSLSETPTVADFLATKRSYESLIEKINTKINSVSALPSVMKSSPGLSVQNQVLEIQNRYNINLEPLIQNYTEQISSIANKLNDLSFKLKAGNGNIVLQKGLSIGAEISANQYSADDIAKMRAQIAEYQVIDTKEQNAKKAFNDFTLINLNSALLSYGKAYRSNQDESGMKESLKMIEQIFFARSVIRAQYGLPLGAPMLNYELRSFNWDFVSSSNKLTFLSLNNTRTDLQFDMHNRLATALKTQEARTKEVFGSETGLSSRITSAITFLKGERALAGLNIIMIKLLLADLEEEMKINTPGGRRELRSMIQVRYYNTKENEAYFKNLGRELTGMGPADAWKDSGTINTDSLGGIYRLATSQLKNYATRMALANQLELTLAEMDKLSGGQVRQIENDLFK